MEKPRPPHRTDPHLMQALTEIRSASIEFTRAFHAMTRAAPAEAERRREEAARAERRLRQAEEIAARLAREGAR